MLKMKKTLGISLAICFLMSVIAAAVNAAPGNGDSKHREGHKEYRNNHWLLSIK